MGIAITLREYLDNHNIDYELIPHPHSSSSSESAHLGHVSGYNLAKAVVLENSAGDYLMAVIPATHKLDLGALHREYGQLLGLATESELETLFTDCELGAVPAVGQAYGLPTIVDDALEEVGDIFFESGSHTDLVHIEGSDFNDLMSQETHGSFSHRL